MRVGAVIRGWRERERYGIREASKMIGVSASTLSRVENGKAMRGKELIKLWDWLMHEEVP
jgi:transcriptional regulator with XRE-family HTH domain